ncbi:type II secretion system protein GspM [Pseudomonas sp. SIMBA_077]
MKARLRERWRQLPRRDRQLCGVLAVFLGVVLGFYCVWQPAQQRLAKAQALYAKRVVQAAEVQRAQPAQTAKVHTQPLSSRLSKSAENAGLNVQQFEMDTQMLRITLSGNALAVLEWLHRIEQEGAQLANLTLEKNDQALAAQLQITNP